MTLKMLTQPSVAISIIYAMGNYIQDAALSSPFSLLRMNPHFTRWTTRRDVTAAAAAGNYTFDTTGNVARLLPVIGFAI